MFLKIKQTLAVWLIKKMQKYGPRKVRVLGRTYAVSEEVFNPKFYYTSRFMAENINVKKDDTVLDMGTGSGIQAITAGQTASTVVAVDINPEAVRYAGKNVKANALENIVTVMEGDLYSSLNSQYKFNVILFTPPYMKGKIKTALDHALYDFNKELIRRFFTQSKGFIKPGGYIQMLYSSIADPEETLEISQELGWKHMLIAQKKTFSEIFLIYRFTLN
jgi:release factor glutamine methyltransferase